MEVCYSLGLDVDRCVGSEVGSTDGITFGINNVYEMSYFDVSLDDLN